MEELKSIKDQILKSVFSAVSSTTESNSEGVKTPVSALRDLIGGLASIAGKGKDEIVQMISREIGLAVAGVIKEPVLKILESKKVHVTIELINRDSTPKKQDSATTKSKRPRVK